MDILEILYFYINTLFILSSISIVLNIFFVIYIIHKFTKK